MLATATLIISPSLTFSSVSLGEPQIVLGAWSGQRRPVYSRIFWSLFGDASTFMPNILCPSRTSRSYKARCVEVVAQSVADPSSSQLGCHQICSESGVPMFPMYVGEFLLPGSVQQHVVDLCPCQVHLSIFTSFWAFFSASSRNEYCLQPYFALLMVRRAFEAVHPGIRAGGP